MRTLILGLIGVWRGLRHTFDEPESRIVGLAAMALLVIGTMFYTYIEGWHALDAFYFSVMTLATVGYGDLAPQTPVGRLFTVIYVLMGLAVIAAFAQRVARGAFQGTQAVRRHEASQRSADCARPGRTPRAGRARRRLSRPGPSRQQN